jgi:two-component sensor histidine kinase
VVTPLSVVMTELLQNAVDHGGFSAGGGSVVVRLSTDGSTLAIDVVDDGRGIPPDFDLSAATGLGLSIVRTLVTTELAGTIEMRPALAGDLTDAGMDGTGTGTVVSLRVPVDSE